jgi:hypothetical protein
MKSAGQLALNLAYKVGSLSPLISAHWAKDLVWSLIVRKMVRRWFRACSFAVRHATLAGS